MARFDTYENIKKLIVNRELTGAITEADISKKLNVSRTPVRESLTLLMHEGWITSKSERIKIVADVSFRELKQIYQIRFDLESLALKLAWQKIDLDKIKTLMDEMKLLEKNGDLNAMHRIDREFHTAIFEATDNTFLISTLSHMNDRLSLLRDERQDYFVKQSNKEHFEIASSIVHDDLTRATLLLKEHIDQSYKRLIEIV